MTTDLNISDRLSRAIRGACLGMSGVGIEALGKQVREGTSPWFVDEFSEAIRSGKFTPEGFGRLVGFDWDDEDADQLDESLREIWDAVAPGKPYPGDQPSE